MSGYAPIKIVAADPHTAMRATIGLLLEGERDFDVIAAFADLSQATRTAARRGADVLILDLHMLEGSSRATVADLRRRLPNTAIVILTMEASPAFVEPLLAAGASAYVLKEFAEVELAEAVRQAALGDRFVSQKLTA